ncbi:MAG: WapI family immunity protein [Thermogutta sp.]
MFQFAIRGEGRDFLAVSVLGRSHPGAMDYWDGNWLQATVEVTAGGFRGSAAGDVRADELVCFHGQLVRLQDQLQGTAEFETMERWLSIRGTGDGKGHIEFRCMIRDQPGTGNTLNCTLATDQTFVRNTVTDLAEVIRAFPVVR